jgi:hypothetical protein
VDISVWRTFPSVGLHISKAKLADSLGIALLDMQEVSFRIGVFQYIGGNTNLQDLSLKNGSIFLYTDSSGSTNKYLYDKDPEADQRKNRVELNSASLKNVRITIANKQKNKRFDVLFKTLKADIDNSDESVRIDIDQDALVHGLGFNLAKGSFLKESSFAGNIVLTYKKKTSHLSFKESKVKINGHPFLLKGDFWMDKPGSFLVDIKTKQVPFETLRRVFAQNTYNDMKSLEIEKPMDVEARLAGSLGYKTIPKVTAKWKLENSKFVTPVATLTGTSFNGSFTNEVTKGMPFTDENSGISLSGFVANWEGIQLKGDSMRITNLVQPQAYLDLQSNTDMKTLNEQLGLRTIQFLGGKAWLNLHYEGPLQKDVSLVEKLNGSLRFSGGTIKYVPRDFTFNNCSGEIGFSSDAIRTNNLSFDLGSNHFNVTVDGSNLSALSATDPGKAVIECKVHSPALNVAELMSLFDSRRSTAVVVKKAPKAFSPTNKIDDALDHGRLKIGLTAGTVRHNNFHGSNLQGTVLFANNELSLSGMSLQHAEGSMAVNAQIKQQGASHNASANVVLTNVDVAKVFKAFDDFGQDGISNQNLRGKLMANANMVLTLNNTGKIVPGTMQGSVDFSLKNGALLNYGPMQDIKGFVFKDKDMSNVAFAELKNKLLFSNNKVNIPRMEIQSTAIGMFVEGVYDLKKTESKINIQVPLKGMKRDSTYVPTNIGLDAKAGTSVYLQGKNDKTGKVKIGLNTSRTLRKLI